MFYLAEVEDYVRVEPKLFGLATLEAVKNQLYETYSDYVSKDLGKVVSIVDVLEVGEGIIIPGDGAAYYKSKFRLLVWRAEIQELVFGVVTEITNFGAFMNLGAMQGMIHISQTMDDYVSFSKSNTLIGKSSKKSLKKNDFCLARVVAISFRGDEPKIGLTMRQPGLGNLEWIKDEKRKAKQSAKEAERAAEKWEKGKTGGKKKGKK